MERDEIIAVARELMDADGPFILATVGDDTGPRMRWMGDLLFEEPMNAYMAASVRSRKMDQVRANPRAQLMFQDAECKRVVTLFGACRTMDDPETKQKVWDGLPILEHFVSGPDDPSLGILLFETERIELLMIHEHGETPLVVEL